MGGMEIGGGGGTDFSKLLNLDDPVSGFQSAGESIEEQTVEAAQHLAEIFGDTILSSPLDLVVASMRDVEAEVFAPVLVGPSDFNNQEVHDISTRLENTQATEGSGRSGPIKGNAWLAPNPFVMFRMVFFETMAILQAAKAIEKLVDVAQMNQVWDLGQTAAGLIMASAKAEAMKMIVSAVMNVVNSVVQFGMLGSSVGKAKAAKGEFAQQGKAMQGNVDNAQGAVNRQKALVDQQPGATNGTGTRAGDNDAWRKFDSSSAKYDGKVADLKKNGFEKIGETGPGARAGQAPGEAPHGTEVYRNSETGKMVEVNKPGGEPPFSRPQGNDIGELNKAQDKLEEAQNNLAQHNASKTAKVNDILRTKMTHLQLMSEAVRGATQGIENAAGAYFTLQKGALDAMIEVTKAARTIAEKAMSSASQAHTEATDLITKLLEQLTAMTKANMQAHQMSR